MHPRPRLTLLTFVAISALSLAAQEPPPKAPPLITAATNDAATPKTRKVSGMLLDLLSASSAGTEAVVPASELGEGAKRSGLPPIRFSVQTDDPAQLSNEVKTLVGDRAGARVFTVEPDPILLELLVNDNAVRTIDIQRPVVTGPTMTFRPFNLDARISHDVPALARDHGVDGMNVKVLIIDGGAVRSTHVELARSNADTTSRVEVRSLAALSDHATHVAGTIGSRGKNRLTLGMAPAIGLVSEDFDDDLRKLEQLGAGVHISNHSYGPIAGWDAQEDQSGTVRWFWRGDKTLSTTEDAKFGKYTQFESELDRILRENPFLTAFVAAGNDRNDGPVSQPISHHDLERVGMRLVWKLATDTHRNDGWDSGGGTSESGFDTITGFGLAKNAICVGSIDDIRQGSTIQMVSYSGFGPADDGRIKPDVVANGQQLFSLAATGDEDYYESSGTSMASPTAAGIGALLMQLYRKTRSVDASGAAPTSAEMKALMIHTARDAGMPGPDAVFGWGAIDAAKAGAVLAGTGQHIVGRQTTSAATPFRLVLPSDGQDLRVTVAWIDPAAAANTLGIDEGTPTLQHDLDLIVTSPSGIRVFPWALSRATPAMGAQRLGPNRTDNVEVVQASAESGDWTIEVVASRLAAGVQQEFAIITTGLKP